MIWRYKVFEINCSSGYYDQLVFVVKKGGWNYLPVGNDKSYFKRHVYDFVRIFKCSTKYNMTMAF